MSIREDIVELLREDFVSFAQLAELPGCKGTLVLEIAPNTMLWANLSQDAAEAIIALRAEGLLRYEPCNVLVYYCDGAVPALPVARRPRSSGYKKPHWLPVTLRPGMRPKRPA